MHVATVRKVQMLAKNARKDLYDAGKRMFDGEFKLSNPKVAKDFKRHKDDIDTWLSNRDRVLFTDDVLEKAKYVTKVADEIHAYNSVRPTQMPLPDPVWNREAALMRSGRHRLDVFYKELAAAFKERRASRRRSTAPIRCITEQRSCLP